MKAIVAVDENWGIGCENDLLYVIPQDMQYFKETTTGKVVVMGHNTFLSLPGSAPLPNRINIVLSDQPDLLPDSVIVCTSIPQLLDTTSSYDPDNVFIIGGQAVYAQMLDYCSSVLVTKIKGTKPADTHYPNLDELPNWTLAHESDEHDHEGLKFTFCEYTNNEIVTQV